jgi:hypothetical protein
MMPYFEPYVDAHCDTLFRCLETGEGLMKNGGHVDLERLSAYAPMGQIFAIFANSKEKSKAECIALVEKMAALLRDTKRTMPELMKHCFLSL